MEIYNRIISSQGTVSRQIAQNVFSLLLRLRLDLKPKAFLELVQLDYSLVTVSEMLDICCNLVILDETIDIIRFAHLSVREFLQNLPDYSAQRAHSIVSLCCLRQIDRWNGMGIMSWNWGSRGPGRYINMHLRYHLEKAGAHERLGLVEYLLSLLKLKNISTLDGAYGRRDRNWRLRRHPENFGASTTCLFNACALEYLEIFELLLDIILGYRSNWTIKERPSNIDDLSLTVDIPILSDSMDSERCQVLAVHIIECGNSQFLRTLCEKRLLPLHNARKVVIRAASDSSVEETGAMNVLLDFFGLECLTTDVIREAIRSAYRRTGPGHENGTDNDTLLVKEFLERGLVFPIHDGFLGSIFPKFSKKIFEMCWDKPAGPNSRWALESIILLLEADLESSVPIAFVESVVNYMDFTEQQLQKLLCRCRLNDLSQKQFETLAPHCRSWATFGPLIEQNPHIFIDEVFFLGIFKRQRGKSILEGVLESPHCQHLRDIMLNQKFFDTLVQYSEWETIQVLSPGFKVAENVLARGSIESAVADISEESALDMPRKLLPSRPSVPRGLASLAQRGPRELLKMERTGKQ
jgi:hypothetical protein